MKRALRRANLRMLCRSVPIVPASAPWIAGFALAGLIGLLVTPLWMALMRFRGAAKVDIADPVFSKDLSFYLLALPFYEDIVEIVIAVLCLTIVLWLIAGVMLFRDVRTFGNRVDFGANDYGPTRIIVLWPTSGARNAWMGQGLMLGALLCIALGASRFLAQYHLVADGHSKVVAGASYADINFWIPGYNLVVAYWFAAALILLLAAINPRFRIWLLVRPSHWLAPTAVLAVLGGGAFVVPAGIESFYVAPNQITLEMPYLVRSIAGTRAAYNIEAPAVEEREFSVDYLWYSIRGTRTE